MVRRHLRITAIAIAPISILVVLTGCLPWADKSGDTYFEEARQARQADRVDEARTLARQAIDEGDQESRARELLAAVERQRAETMAAEGDDDGAYETFLLAADYEPSRTQRSDDRHRALDVGRRAGIADDELLELARRVLEDRPGDLELRRDTARLAEEVGEAEIAERHYLWVFSADPTDTRVGLRLGIIYLSLDRPADAAAVLERTLDADPDNIQAAINLTDAYAALSRHDDNIALYDELVARHPDNPAILQRYAEFMQEIGEYDRARQIRQKLDRASPDEPDREMRPLR